MLWLMPVILAVRKLRQEDCLNSWPSWDSQWVVARLDYMGRLCLSTTIKINSRWIRGLDVGKIWILTPLEEIKVKKLLQDIDIGKDVQNRWQFRKQEKNGQMKFESFCLAKETTSKLKRCPTKQQKNFARCSVDKGLMTRIIHKEQKPNKKRWKNK